MFDDNKIIVESEDEILIKGAHGMTLRDYFAACSITALVAVAEWRDDEWRNLDDAAAHAYAMADAMLKEREK